MGPIAVKVDRLTQTYVSGDDKVTVFEDVNFAVDAGAVFAIQGVSGSGKTSLLNVIGALDVATSGSVSVFGKAISGMNEEQRSAFRRENLGFVFQFYNLLPNLTASENVKVGLELLRMPKAAMEQAAAYYLNAVGLASKGNRLPSQLSGGEQQRVAIARALAKKPMLVLADEPTGNLDRATGHSVLALMRHLNESLGTTFIIVTHDPEVSAAADSTFLVGSLPPNAGALKVPRAITTQRSVLQ